MIYEHRHVKMIKILAQWKGASRRATGRKLLLLVSPLGEGRRQV